MRRCVGGSITKAGDSSETLSVPRGNDAEHTHDKTKARSSADEDAGQFDGERLDTAITSKSASAIVVVMIDWS